MKKTDSKTTARASRSAEPLCSPVDDTFHMLVANGWEWNKKRPVFVLTRGRETAVVYTDATCSLYRD